MDPEKTPEKSGGRQALVVVGVLGAIAVNIAAFMLSADAINAVAVAAGISKHIAWAQVLAVDGLMVTGTVVFIANKLRGRSVVYPLCVLGSGVLLSIWCNALHAKAGGGHIVHLGGNAKMGVSAIPAVSLALSFHLIADMVKDSLGVTEASSVDTTQAVSSTVSDTTQNTVADTIPTVSSTVSEPVSDTAENMVQNTAADTAEDTATDTTPTRARKPAKRRGAPVSRHELARQIYDAHMDEHGAEPAIAELMRQLKDAGHPTGNKTAAVLLDDIRRNPLRLAQAQ